MLLWSLVVVVVAMEQTVAVVALAVCVKLLISSPKALLTMSSSVLAVLAAVMDMADTVRHLLLVVQVAVVAVRAIQQAQLLGIVAATAVLVAVQQKAPKSVKACLVKATTAQVA